MGDCGVECALCAGGHETSQHLLFDYENAKQVRKGVFNFLDHTWNVRSWEDEIKFMAKMNRKKTSKAKLIVICWIEMIYVIWMQRNQKLFAETGHSVLNVVKKHCF